MKQFNTPILLIIFNRPDLTKETLQAILNVNPKKLYIVADGPRNKKEEVLCEETRKAVDDLNLDNCKIFKNYSSINLGVNKRISSGINWFFENEEMGIILEDDCLPNKSFFYYAEELLEKYKDDNRVGVISAYNNFDKTEVKESYLFSKNSYTWGWATWKRAWEKYDGEMLLWKNNKKEILNKFKNPFVKLYYYLIINATYKGKIKAWDYRWILNFWENNFLGIIPKVNLIKNTGIGREDASTTKRSDITLKNMKSNSLDFPLIHPEKIEANKDFEKKEIKIVYWRLFRYLIGETLRTLKIIKR